MNTMTDHGGSQRECPNSLTVTRMRRRQIQGELAITARFGTGGRLQVRRTPLGGIAIEVWTPANPYEMHASYEAVPPRNGDQATVWKCFMDEIEHLTGPSPMTESVLYQQLTHQEGESE